MAGLFKVTNGVRQGGILSPYLFCVYADELSRMLNNVNAGCFVGASLVNHTGMDNLFVQPASRTLIACPGRTDGLCPSQVERNNDVPLFAVDARNT